MEIYIGVGSNLGDSKKNCETAIDALNSEPKTSVIKRSSLYETEPMGVKDQNWFINAVVKIKTFLTPTDLLSALLSIELQMGRVRKKKWGTRIIDLDLLLYKNSIIRQPGLQIPHPRIQDRIFVLAPLCEVYPDAFHPLLKQTASQLLNALPNPTSFRKLVSSN